MNKRHNNFIAEVKEMLSQLQPATIEEANAALKELQDRRNYAPVPEFQGLSPAMMHRFLHFAMDSPELIEFPQSVTDFPGGFRLATLFEMLMSAIGEKGIKATAAGNLPLSVVKSIAIEWLTPEEYSALTNYSTIRTESNFRQLHVTLILCELSGMIRKVHGRFLKTKACLQLQERSGFNEIYPRLFKAYVNKFNWQYLYDAPETTFMQGSFAFTLYMLDKFGDLSRPASFYEDAFFNAFPQFREIADEIEFRAYLPLARYTFTTCNFANFGEYFGFIEVEYDKSDLFRLVTEVRKTELLEQLVRFRVAIP